MKFPSPLVPARLLKRYKRFLADVELEDGTILTTHVANPGAMTGLLPTDARIWLSKSESASRKLPYSWELVETDFGNGMEFAGVNTAHANTLVAEALTAGGIVELKGYATVRREVKYGAASRIDFLLDDPGKPPCYVEVKNVSLMRSAGRAEFPDAVTARGTKHLAELADMVAGGARAVLLFVIQIGSATSCGVARDIDPAYGRAFDQARQRGVEVLAHRCRITTDSIALGEAVPVNPWAGKPIAAG